MMYIRKIVALAYLKRIPGPGHKPFNYWKHPYIFTNLLEKLSTNRKCHYFKVHFDKAITNDLSPCQAVSNCRISHRCSIHVT